MSFDRRQFDQLLEQARQYAEQAAANDEPALYREAFLAMHQALMLVGEEASSWREEVVRATEEYTRTEGI